jgi:hypothetical protein
MLLYCVCPVTYTCLLLLLTYISLAITKCAQGAHNIISSFFQFFTKQPATIFQHSCNSQTRHAHKACTQGMQPTQQQYNDSVPHDAWLQQQVLPQGVNSIAVAPRLNSNAKCVYRKADGCNNKLTVTNIARSDAQCKQLQVRLQLHTRQCGLLRKVSVPTCPHTSTAHRQKSSAPSSCVLDGLVDSLDLRVGLQGILTLLTPNAAVLVTAKRHTCRIVKRTVNQSGQYLVFVKHPI